MPWSDDTRCLYCDGKLPLFRKLAHGQFCSKAHQKKYWDEQQQLAVERLHQTHSDIQAYRPPEPIENILGPLGPTPETDFSFLEADAASILGPTVPPRSAPAETPAETLAGLGVADGPAIAGFLTEVIGPVSGQVPPFIATGSLDFGAALHPTAPGWAAPGASGATLRLRAAADYLWAWFQSTFESVAAPLRGFAGYPAIEPVFEVRQPAHQLSVAVPDAASEVLPALERQFEIAGPEPQAAAIAPHGTVMASAVSTSGFTLPSFAARLRGLAFEVPSDYEPPLVEKLRAIEWRAKQAEIAPARQVETEADYSHTAAGRPEFGDSSRPVVSAAASELSLGAPQQLEPALPASFTAVAAGEPRSIERNTGETQRPVLEGVAVPVSGLAPSKLQALELVPRAPLHSLATSDLQPAAPPALEAAQPEPKPIGSPLAPNPLDLARLPWHMEISGAPVWDPAPSRALLPQVTAVLPAGTGAAVIPVTLEPAVENPVPAESPTVEGPIDIPGQAGHVPMQHALTVDPANRQTQPILVRNVIPEPLVGLQFIPKLRINPLPVEFAAPAPMIEVETAVPGAVIEAEAARRGALSGIRNFWAQAPRDLKLLAVAIPILIGLAFQTLPKVSVSAPETDGISGNFRQVLNEQFANLKRTVASRAAIALDEDFRGGIDNWISRTGATAEWSFDATGFVQPGPLALYEPSLKLTDYQMQFLGMIDQKSMSWVARADDFENYYVIKLVVLKSGPLPTIGLTRYAVIDGKAVDRVDRPVPIGAREDTIYRVRMDVHGSNFSLEVQGQMVDTWTETRLKRGGIGFFTGRGEKSSIRWVQLTHQYDALGRLCAYLVPYEF